MFLGDRIIGGTSAYSKVAYEVSTRLAAAGHSVAQVPMAMANRMGKWSHKGVLIYPSGRQSFGEDVAVEHYLDWNADMLITVKEPWVFDRVYREPINFAPMAIIDHSPVSPAITVRLHTAFKVLAISRFGQRELRQNDIESTYMPHGVDTEVYKPWPEHRADCRKMFFLDPDEVVILIVAMNRVRKMIPRMLEGCKLFFERNPDVKGHVMLWSRVRPSPPSEEVLVGGVADVGVDLLPEIMQTGMGEAVRWPDEKLIDQGIPEWSGEDWLGGWDMVKLYNTATCLLLCSGGEGFGLPLIEAQACGVPVIGTDYAGGPEQIGEGVAVPWRDHVILNTPGTRYALADKDAMAEAIARIVNGDPERMARRARKFAERYDWKQVMEKHWKPFLEECETELRPMVTKEGVKPWS